MVSALADREIEKFLVLHCKAFEPDDAKIHAALLPNLALRKFQSHRRNSSQDRTPPSMEFPGTSESSQKIA